jgi:hypothetical protein
MQALTQTFNNNWSYEGEGPGPGSLSTKWFLSVRYWDVLFCFVLFCFVLFCFVLLDRISLYEALTGLELTM